MNIEMIIKLMMYAWEKKRRVRIMPRAFSVNMVIPHELKLMKLMIDDDDFDAQILLSLQLAAILLINPSLRTATIICMHV